MNKIPAIFSWSGGKESAYALYKVLEEDVYEVKYLVSTFNGNYNRLSMHGVREALIDAQADSIGIPLLKVFVFGTSNEEYETQMAFQLRRAKGELINHVIFGDIFLEDLRLYREESLARIGMQCVFPIWQIPTRLLLEDFVAKGFKTITCCVNDGYLDETWCGRIIDDTFLNALPANVDPCGENGEFHSFCFEAPFFRTKLGIEKGDLTYRALELKMGDCPLTEDAVPTKGFWFADLRLQLPLH